MCWAGPRPSSGKLMDQARPRPVRQKSFRPGRPAAITWDNEGPALQSWPITSPEQQEMDTDRPKVVMPGLQSFSRKIRVYIALVLRQRHFLWEQTGTGMLTCWRSQQEPRLACVRLGLASQLERSDPNTQWWASYMSYSRLQTPNKDMQNFPYQ